MREKRFKTKRNRSLVATLMFCFLILNIVSIMLLLLWGIFTALKTQNEFRVNVLWLPEGVPWKWAWQNFATIYKHFTIPVKTERIGVPRMALNTVLYAGGLAFIASIVPCIVAYLVAKFNYFYSKIIYTTVIIVFIIPTVGNEAAALNLLTTLRLYDSIWGRWVSGFGFTGMYFLIYYATFKNLPNDFMEAAYIDGASETGVLFRVVLPLVSNSIKTVFLILFINYWNEYQSVLLYMPSYPTLAYGIYYLSNSAVQGMNTVPMRMAACIFLVVPITILFVAFKDKIMGDISLGGLKE